jgi:hypothetical protein
MQEIVQLLQPAIAYPNCAVRQARLTQMVQALLLQADPPTQRKAETVRQLWVDQDEENTRWYTPAVARERAGT